MTDSFIATERPKSDQKSQFESCIDDKGNFTLDFLLKDDDPCKTPG